MSTKFFTKTGNFRRCVQWGFLAWICWLGFRFAQFVRHFESGGATPFVPRPPGVEGFLPIGALASLKAWLVTGNFNEFHPAALVLFVTIAGMSLLARKSFCSWLCPVGTISETAWRLGRRILGRTFLVWRPLDLFLQGIKYLLLFFFVKTIVLGMPAEALEGFLSDPYWKLSDVKMLHFFTGLSLFAASVIGLLLLLSVLYRNAWCRYLCPYGALLGLAALASPFAVRRFGEKCTNCGACSRACPAAIEVARKERVLSPECTGCLSCVDACPAAGALAVGLPLQPPRSSWIFVAVALGTFAGGVAVGMATGHWQSSLTYDDYRQLIPMLPYLSH